MKRCPNCKRSYSDESLNFCLDDGTVLVAVDHTVTDENIGRPTEPKTEILPPDKITESIPTDKQTQDYNDEKDTVVRSQPSVNDSQPQIIKQGVSPLFAYLSVGLLALLVLLTGAGIALWVNSNSSSDSNAEFAKRNSNESNLRMDDLQDDDERVDIKLTDKEKPTPKKDSKKEVKETPKKEEDNKKTPKPTPTESNSPTPTPETTPKPEKGRFYVILGSFKNPANAKKRLQLARSKGLPARIINTSNVPGLRSGLRAVVVGPFSKKAAQKALSRARSVSSDAYVKAG